MWGGRLGSKLEDFIFEEQPDILCLQEAIDLEGGRGALFVSVEELCEILKTKFYYMAPVYRFNYMHRKADFGNCIISKFPILNKETIFTGKQYIPDFDWTKHNQNIRNLQHIQIQLPTGKVLNVFNHHGHHNHKHKDGDAETMRQCSIIAEAVETIEGSTILAGDFNLTPHSKSLEQINYVLKNLSVQAGLKTTRTVLTSKTEVCDYIFVSQDVQVASFEASDELISDHKALLLNFS